MHFIVSVKLVFHSVFQYVSRLAVQGGADGLQRGRFRRYGCGAGECRKKSGEEYRVHVHGLLASEMMSLESPCTTSANWG